MSGRSIACEREIIESNVRIIHILGLYIYRRFLEVLLFIDHFCNYGIYRHVNGKKGMVLLAFSVLFPIKERNIEIQYAYDPICNMYSRLTVYGMIKMKKI